MRTYLLPVTLALASASLVQDWARADDPRARVPTVFRGQVLAISCKNATDGWVALRDVKVQALGSRSFLVGTPIDLRGREPAGPLPTWIAVDEVVRVREYADVDALKAAVAREREAESAPADVSDWDGLSVKFPIDYAAGGRKRIARLKLFVSADRGRTWKSEAEGGPDAEFLPFTAPKAGEYWFALQVIGPDDKADPPGDDLTAGMKLRLHDPEADKPPRIPPGRP